MARYLAVVEYIGAPFNGLQKQLNTPNTHTVQSVLDGALGHLVRHPVVSHFSSRTDKGVHAMGNTAHFELRRVARKNTEIELPPYPPEVVCKALNFHLQEEQLAVVNVTTVPPDFHARFSATSRTYLYCILCNTQIQPLLERGRSWHVKHDLDVARMQAAATRFLGSHDFTSFRGARCQSPSALRSVEEVEIWCESSPYCPLNALAGHGRMIYIRVKARSFLYHMVRNIAGCLKEVGEHQLEPADVDRLLLLRDRQSAPPMAPAEGLYLLQVEYPAAALQPQGEMQ